ncbi:hypothetical protein RJ641_001187 [Dillenia turbinata]|uniref:DUF4378 domain-containing protein n=1 Tax=Dillenia turbinata TaxID=194707 RepID=A0AAN8ZN19_9MAGN
MASVMDPRMGKQNIITMRSLMLKDFLRDDLSSCSSSGFKSYPRTHCCPSTIRFLLERDLKANNSQNRSLCRSRSKAASQATISAFQRASEVVLNAVKLLPFHSVNSPSRSRKTLLQKSLSTKRLFKMGFWRKPWLTSSDEFTENKSQPLDCEPTIATVTTSSDSTNTNSWSDSDFSAEYSPTSSSENDVVGSKIVSPKTKIAASADDDEDSVEFEAAATTSTRVQNCKKQLLIEEEKEQFSPVSVLGFPYEDEEEVCSSHHQNITSTQVFRRVPRLKSRPFKCSQLKPMDLEKCMALAESAMVILEEKHDQFTNTQEKAEALLILAQSKTSTNNIVYQEENLLLDFFQEKIAVKHSELELLKVAEDWINGKNRELVVEWEVQEKRNAYIKDMEEGGRWRRFDEEKEELVLELENRVFLGLMNEVLGDILST